MINNAYLSYFVLRVGLGLNLLMHGLARIFGGVSNFTEPTIQEFSKTFLPTWSVSLFLNVLPYFEGGLGLLILFGLFTRFSLVLVSVEMLFLMFGMTLLEKWDLVGTQMIYLLTYYILLLKSDDNKWSLDKQFDTY